MGHIVGEIKNNPVNNDKLIIKDSEDSDKYKEIEFLKIKAASGDGDMLQEVYDPGSIREDVFDMDNMIEGVNNKILTSAERSGLDNVLPGLLENKDHVSKIDDLNISITAGSAKIRKSDGTLHYVSWDAIPSYMVVIDDTLPWVVFKWNAEETDVEIDLFTYLPSTLKEIEEIAIIGRLWFVGEDLNVSGRHMLLSDDVYISRTEAWKYPSKNISIRALVSSTNNNYVKLTSGELSRWPINNIISGSHVFEYNGDEKVDYIWGHLQGQSSHDEIIENELANQFDVKAIADWYDLNGVATLVPPQKFTAHIIGAYAKSDVLVWWRGQHIYDTLDDAKHAVHSDIFNDAPWLQDRQISKIAWIIMIRGARDFTNELDVAFVNYHEL